MLIVEDEVVVALDLKSELESLDYDVIGVADNEEKVLKMVAQHKPDVVLMDIILKGDSDGVEIAKKITEKKVIPVVFLTAHSDKKTLERVKEVNHFGYITKPFDIRQVHTAIQSAINKYQYEQIFMESNRWFNTTLNSIADAVIATDENGKVRFMNPVAESLTGWSNLDAIEKGLSSVLNIINKDTGKYIADPFDEIVNKGASAINNSKHLLVSKGGEQIYIQVSGSKIKNEKGRIEGAVLVFQNVTEKVKSEERIYDLAYRDKVTGIANRSLFNDKLQEMFENLKQGGGQLALILIDIDRFTYINSSIGVLNGDNILREVGERLQNVQNDIFVARIGDDEFGILMNKFTFASDPSRLVRSINKALEKKFEVDGLEIKLTVSCGISMIPFHTRNMDDLIKFAESALEAAKDAGGSSYEYYTPEYHSQQQSDFRLEFYLRNSIENEELQVFYQPIIDLNDDSVIGLEALVRLESEELGILTPTEFLDVAVRSGFINELDQWVVNKVFENAAGLLEVNPNLKKFTINISFSQFNSDLVAVIQEASDRYKFPLELLELEITESIAMHKSASSIDIIMQLREMGVKVVIDDFGAGFSSFNQLRSLPVSMVKIDKSFIDGIVKDKSKQSVVSAIIAMCKALKLDVGVEGVEDDDQKELVKKMGCKYMQGFLVSHPLPLEIVQEFLSIK